MSDEELVKIYTDGACSGNPGPGGWGAVLIFGENVLELNEGYRLTTNNRMEILAVVESLNKLKRYSRVVVISDSKYLVDAINKRWVHRWQLNRWKRNKKDLASNSDLWKLLLVQLDRHKVKFEWIKGHSGDTYNDLADKLAVDASMAKSLKIDEVYELDS